MHMPTKGWVVGRKRDRVSVHVCVGVYNWADIITPAGVFTADRAVESKNSSKSRADRTLALEAARMASKGKKQRPSNVRTWILSSPVGTRRGEGCNNSL